MFILTNYKTNHQAFTLVELLVVIVIIGILSTLAIIALGNIRAKSRDAKRVADLKQISTALELFYDDHGYYPTIITPGNSLMSVDGTTAYLAIIPSNPTPRNDGSCPDKNYFYQSFNSQANYYLLACLSSSQASLAAGVVKVSNSSGVASSLILDDSPLLADAAFSLRKLTKNYDGPVIKLRRVDNSEQDFYFKDDLVDLEAIRNWNITNEDLFVVTWYDQSGNAWHKTQTSASAQLKFNSLEGYLYDVNTVTKPGTSTYLQTGSRNFGLLTNLQILAVEYLRNNVGNPSTVGVYSPVSSNIFSFMQKYGGSGNGRWLSRTINSVTVNGSYYGRHAAWDLISIKADENNSIIKWNNNLTQEAFGLGNSYSDNIKMSWAVFKWSDTDMRVKEVIYFINKSMDDSTFDALRQNQNFYFNLY
jgi:prepilin-type N-terminal cleavage/methylation domain-containing protein